jgi:serine/threonine protein phosphatase 1
VTGISSQVKALFMRVRALPTPAGGDRIYAIGDVHGRFDLFRSLIKQLEADVAARRKIPTRIILLGDLIDRGTHSRAVLELIKRMQLQNGDRFVVLCGNHEDMLLASADGNANAQRLWLANGGDATLRSYGLEPSEFVTLTPEQRGDVLWRAVGADMLVWLAALPVHFRSGDYFFCHAGIRPGIPLNEQRREDLLWIRRDFVSSNRRHGAVVVHGHSETADVEIKANRINVDTAAYRSGQLTAVGLQGPYRWFISTAQRYLNRAELDAALEGRTANGDSGCTKLQGRHLY